MRITDNESHSLKWRVKRAQRLVRRHIKVGVLLGDELIAERREAANRELHDHEERDTPSAR
jgi:hypothetical protein